jgi:hypothetical protein
LAAFLMIRTHGALRLGIPLLCILIFLAGAIWSLLQPTRSPQDRLAQTRLTSR